MGRREITFDLDKGIMDIDTHVEEGGGRGGIKGEGGREWRKGFMRKKAWEKDKLRTGGDAQRVFGWWRASELTWNRARENWALQNFRPKPNWIE